ncbi:MAG: twin-arginine translocase TatA/TatE family subunit [Bacteroidales bacterium]|nr:twin-arginine translocase TatA/TatE family subunit [Bacteroidales bacterium]
MVLLGIIGTQEIIFILIIVLILFGAKKIPELMRGLGKGVKEFKDGMNGLEDKDNKQNNDEEKKTPEN